MEPFIRKKNNAKPKQHQNVKKNVVLGGHFTPQTDAICKLDP